MRIVAHLNKMPLNFVLVPFTGFTGGSKLI